eukprot:1270126-Prorocentrum_lima.AAC.1
MESWAWFHEQVAAACPDLCQLHVIIFSDRDKGQIAAAESWPFQNAVLQHCFEHIWRNVKSRAASLLPDDRRLQEEIRELLYTISTSLDPIEHGLCLNAVQDQAPALVEYLPPFSSWCAMQCELPRHEICTSNLVEGFQGHRDIKFARQNGGVLDVLAACLRFGVEQRGRINE